VGERAYLRPDERRRQLLDAASRLFDRGGFTAITVSAVATEAGASRRLVYDHFADLPALVAAFFEDRVARYGERIDAASAAGSDGRHSYAGAAAELLAVPPDDLHALAIVLADGATPELRGARAALREHLHTRWLPILTDQGVEADAATALMWALATSFVSLADQAHRGDLTPGSTETIATAIAATLPDIVRRAVDPPEPDTEPNTTDQEQP
jgi:AcrR family transcriptional regulator